MEIIASTDDPIADYKKWIATLNVEDFGAEYHMRVDDWMLQRENRPHDAEEKFNAINAEADIRDYFPY